MKFLRFFLLLSLLLIETHLLSDRLYGADAPSGVSKPIDFTTQVRPILSNKCFMCHGPDEAERQGSLRLDSLEGLLSAGDTDLTAVRPGQPEESELLRRVMSNEEYEQMPPPESGRSLTAEEKQLLHDWIAQGARYSGHWAYVPPQRPEVPQSENTDWARTPIDRFILHQLQQQGLQPEPKADKVTLIRRLSLDLTGLPPSLEEVEAFVSDDSAEACERLIDRLLASPQYGEHWARKWLDLARYADSAGYADDPPREIWAYRDYVIRSLNANKPFDEFTIEQLAGDLLEIPSEDQLIATAFHRNTMTNNEGGTDDEEFRNAAIVDRVNTTFAVWMGTTMACAQCHTHKYDPITQEEYFQVFAILNNTVDSDKRDERPTYDYYTPQQKSDRKNWNDELADLNHQLELLVQNVPDHQFNWEAEFKAPVQWQSLAPLKSTAAEGVTLTVSDQGNFTASKASRQNTYTLMWDRQAIGQQSLAGLNLITLPEASLPGKGAGYGGGNFVISQLRVEVKAKQSRIPMVSRFRIELPGNDRILSLAEVELFAGGQNIAAKGTASQSSTGFGGDAKLAIDGNTNGDYSGAMSTTHTLDKKDPWWEVRFEQPVGLENAVIWNRTDNGLGSRLANFRMTAFDAEDQILWEQAVSQAPDPNADFRLQQSRPVELLDIAADYSQSGFAAEGLAKSGSTEGWAVGGKVDQSHQLQVVFAKPVELSADETLVLTLQQNSKYDNHTLARFRIELTTDARLQRISQIPNDELAILRTDDTHRTEAQQQELNRYYWKNVSEEFALQSKRMSQLQHNLDGLKPAMKLPVMKELASDQKRETHIQLRGNFLSKGKLVESGLPAALHSQWNDVQQPDRLALARYLVDPANPLTARVIANRYWEAVFGTGLVATSEEFGSQGELPSHPQLLDWLATELIRLDWDMKAFLKTLVMTATYRQSATVRPEKWDVDPDNRLLSRGPRFRISAEMVRDQALKVSGLLSSTMYGPPVNPPQPELGLNAAFGGRIDWKTSQGEDRYRRGIYTTWRRSNPYPSMAAFDAPNREVCLLKRDRTNTPLQALVTLNDPVYIEAAQSLARLMVAHSDHLNEQLRHGFRRCLFREPDVNELSQLQQLYQQAYGIFRDQPAEAMQMATNPLGPVPEGADVTQLAALSVVGNVLLNLDELFMKP